MSRIAVVSDLHCNSTVGLWPPDFVGADGVTKPQNRVQQWLWERWLDFCSQVRPDDLVVINGEPVQGVHASKDLQIMTVSEVDQERAAAKVLQPLASNRLYMVRGTPWHDSAMGMEAERVAQLVGAVPSPLGESSRFSLWLQHDEKLFHFTHHIANTVGGVYETTAPAREIAMAKLEYLENGQPIPDVMVRSHRHRYAEASDGMGHHLFVTPGWQLKNEFGWKVNPIRGCHIGGMFLWVEEQQIRWSVKRYPLMLPDIEQS